jgi:hypothetical protein
MRLVQRMAVLAASCAALVCLVDESACVLAQQANTTTASLLSVVTTAAATPLQVSNVSTNVTAASGPFSERELDVAIVAGGVLAFAVVFFGVVFLWRRSSNRQQHAQLKSTRRAASTSATPLTSDPDATAGTAAATAEQIPATASEGLLAEPPQLYPSLAAAASAGAPMVVPPVYTAVSTPTFSAVVDTDDDGL